MQPNRRMSARRCRETAAGPAAPPEWPCPVTAPPARRPAADFAGCASQIPPCRSSKSCREPQAPAAGRRTPFWRPSPPRRSGRTRTPQNHDKQRGHVPHTDQCQLHPKSIPLPKRLMPRSARSCPDRCPPAVPHFPANCGKRTGNRKGGTRPPAGPAPWRGSPPPTRPSP